MRHKTIVVTCKIKIEAECSEVITPEDIERTLDVIPHIKHGMIVVKNYDVRELNCETYLEGLTDEEFKALTSDNYFNDLDKPENLRG